MTWSDALGAVVIVSLGALAVWQLGIWLLKQAGGLLMDWIFRNY